MKNALTDLFGCVAREIRSLPEGHDYNDALLTKTNSGNIKYLSLPPLSLTTINSIHIFSVWRYPPHILEEWCGEHGEADTCEQKPRALVFQYVEIIGKA